MLGIWGQCTDVAGSDHKLFVRSGRANLGHGLQSRSDSCPATSAQVARDRTTELVAQQIGWSPSRVMAKDDVGPLGHGQASGAGPVVVTGQERTGPEVAEQFVTMLPRCLEVPGQQLVALDQARATGGHEELAVAVAIENWRGQVESRIERACHAQHVLHRGHEQLGPGRVLKYGMQKNHSTPLGVRPRTNVGHSFTRPWATAPGSSTSTSCWVSVCCQPSLAVSCRHCPGPSSCSCPR